MQFNSICSECKEMFLFTDGLMYIRPVTKYNDKIRPLCFRCSTTVGSAIGAQVQVRVIEDKDKDILTIEHALEKFGREDVLRMLKDMHKRSCIQEVLKEKIESSNKSIRSDFDMR